jgi:hypothetical protein
MRKPFSLMLVGALAVGGYAGAGCGSSGGSGFGANDGGMSQDATGHSKGNGKDAGVTLGNVDAAPSKLAIKPPNPTLIVKAPGATEQFTATLGGVAVNAQWTLDTAGTGSIDSHGLFTASGLQGGAVAVTATADGQTAQTTLNLVLELTENPGMVSAATQAQLQAGGAADPAFAWLYPYDKTVFPRDLPAPTLQFAAGPSDAGAGSFDAAMVKVTFAGLQYTGFYGPAALPYQIPLSATAWNAISLSATGTDAVKVQVTKIVGGHVAGPINETWTIATGSLRGSIFYNSYNSTLAGNTGAVLKLRPSEQQLTVVLSSNGGTSCHVCHAVAANGSMIEAADETSGGASQDSVWDLTVDGGAATPVYSAPDRTWDFGAFTPTGSKFLRYGAVVWTGGAAWAPDVRGIGNASTDVPTDLFDPRTGLSLSPSGLDAGPGGTPINMMMPTFSPDGKLVAFNHYDTGLGHTIAVMSFDDATNTFSNLRDVATLPTLFAGWPTFTPDDTYVFFAGGTNDEYSTMSDSPPNPPQPTGNIYIAHVPSATSTTADELNGVTGGVAYLPFPDDPNLNYEPTILPVASGGYYWLVFTTRRNYGNTINGDPYVGPAGAPSPRKKLWVAAVDISPAAGKPGAPTSATDLTHPAFYLDGQELTPGNMRAFWALDPCEQKGTSCQTGDQCCSGFCRQTTVDGGVAFSCVTPPAGCSQANEKCTTASDCCGAAQGYECINGFCAEPSPP